MNKTISILVPVKNEEATLPLLFQELDKRLEELAKKYNFHVLVLDDGSTDSTADVVKRYSSNFYSVGLCSFTRNFGKEAAIAAGLERCESDVYIIMDSDLQHPPSLIPEMVSKWEEGYKIVEGVKLDRGNESLLYSLFSMTFYKALNSMGSLDLKNLSDYKLIDRELVDIIRSLPEKSRFFRGLIDWMGYPKHQIPFHVPDREAGTTSWSSWQLIKFSLSAISSFSSVPLQFVTVIGMSMLAISVLLGSVTLYQWASGQAVTGFTTVIILLLVIGSMLMVSLGLIGLYLARIYEEIKGRPAYMIKEEVQTSPNQGGK
jgi:dolichol-phosphate mannosyltransferase